MSGPNGTKTRNYIVTPKGIAIYPHINGKSDTKFQAGGEWHLKLAIPKPHASKLLDQLKVETDRALRKATEENPKHAGRITVKPPYSEGEDEYEGALVFRFGMRHKVEPRNGTPPFEQQPAVFDKYGKPLDDSIIVANGSVVQVRFSPRPYFIAKDREAGIALGLSAVMVYELQELGRGQSAERMGFDVEESNEGNDASGRDTDSADF